jgi:hypothetical protein
MRPNYIATSRIAEVALDLAWKGKDNHIGPIEGTEMHAAFGRLTFFAAHAVALGAYEWAAYRLANYAENAVDLELIEAARAWQVDAKYLKEDPLEIGDMVERLGSPANEALSKLGEMTARTLRGAWRRTPHPGPSQFAHIAYLTRHTMPKKQRQPFDDWLTLALQRAAALAPRPASPMPSYQDCNEDRDTYAEAARPYLGVPLPPSALDPAASYSDAQRAALLDAFLERLDPARNRFLASAQEMREAGFEGTPYRYAE